MPYKIFVNGFPLNASELNTFVMPQTISTFVDAAAREAAIENPVEGQFSYLTGLNQLTKYNGSAWENVDFATESAVQEKAVNYTIVAGDANSYIYATDEITITVADVLSPGETVNFIQNTEAAITFVADTGVTLNSKGDLLSTNGQFSGASLTCKASNSYYLVGDLA
jgi:peptidoglycan hydrolase-like protein with peptidoglycan-binding domain